jgi:hypothetical protein
VDRPVRELGVEVGGVVGPAAGGDPLAVPAAAGAGGSGNPFRRSSKKVGYFSRLTNRTASSGLPSGVGIGTIMARSSPAWNRML